MMEKQTVPRNLSLAEIVDQIDVIEWHHYRPLTISDVHHDSRNVVSGCLFVAIAGTNVHGAKYLQQAVANGAIAIIAEEYHATSVPLAIVPCARTALAILSALRWGQPARRLQIIGVTGTNGKTTVTFFINSILRAANYQTGVLGTIGYWCGDCYHPAAHTTPDARILQQHLAQMVAQNVTHVTMEVSSHALAQKRLAQIDFRAAVFTNLSRDHLDYHGDFSSYYQAKSLLFQGLTANTDAIFNNDDDISDKLRNVCRARHHSFALQNANVWADDIHYSARETTFTLMTPHGNARVALGLPGRHNIYNALAAATCALALNISLASVVVGLQQLECVPGRMELVDAGQDFAIIVDYAHSPDALQAALTTLQQVKQRRLLLVFGCGGDRDRGKRPEMGAVADRHADYTWITSDNPRSENPQEIARQIISGFTSSNYQVVLNRKQAIYRALKIAMPQDIVLIAGKGHERLQIIDKQTIVFDDREVVMSFFD